MPKMMDERMEKIIRSSTKAMTTRKEDLIASLTPFSSFSILGMKWNILNDLNSRMERSASTVLVAIVCSISGFAREGRDISNMMKSNLFHLLAQ